MSEKSIPATTPLNAAAEPAEFNFTKPPGETPRIKRRSLKAKNGGLTKPASSSLPAARELAREAPPLSVEQAQKPGNVPPETKASVMKEASPSVAPPRSTPSVTATPSQPASTTVAAKTSAPAPQASTAPASTTAGSSTSANNSPHGTRPATLYYSSYPRKEKEASPMKTIPTTSSASNSSAASNASAATRPNAAAARSNPNIDYRANVERQSREQKSVGSILSYVVYGLIAFFVIGVGLAGYGANVIFKQLHEQSVTVSDLDQRYAEANKELTAKLSATQDTLAQAQAQINRQQDVIMKQQEDLNRLLTETTENANAIKTEKQSRAQETSALRLRLRELEAIKTTQKY